MRIDLFERPIRAVLGTALTLALAAPRPTAAQAPGVDVGSRVPNPAVSTVPSAGDKVHVVELHALMHNPTLIIFWAFWDPSCADLEQQLAKLYQNPAKKPPAVQIVRIAVTEGETPAAVQSYVERHPMPGTIFYDAHASDHDLLAGVAEAAKAFAVPAVSYFVLVDKTGHVIYVGIGSGQDLGAILAMAK